MNDQLPLFDPVEGLRRKGAGLDRVEQHNEEWLTLARRQANHLAKSGLEVTSDMVIARVGMPPADVHPNVIGSIFRHGFHRVGYTKSERPSAHGRMIGIWVKKAG